ncbi:uncharacterized protein LJ264_005489 [Porphyrio hochstetteri]
MYSFREEADMKIQAQTLTDQLFTKTSAHTSGSTTVQADCSSGYEPWVVGAAAGIPSFVALVLAVILAVFCVLQRKSYSCNQMNQHPSGQEEHEYESSPPRPPDDFYMTMMQATTNIYVNEEPDKHCKPDIQAQQKPMRMKKTRGEPSAVESIYENHPPYS